MNFLCFFRSHKWTEIRFASVLYGRECGRCGKIQHSHGRVYWFDGPPDKDEWQQLVWMDNAMKELFRV